MAIRTSLETGTEQTLHNGVATLAFPTAATDGASISVDEVNKPKPATAGAWRRGGGLGGGTIDAAIFIESSQAMTLSAGVGLYGYRADTLKWYLLGQLNGGAAISTLGANTGWSTIVETIGIFDRLAVGPLAAGNVTPSGGTFTIKACQIRQVEDIWA